MAWSKDSLIRLSTVDSTNRYVRDEAATLWAKSGFADGLVVVSAEHQTAGRGQRGNTWNSNAGENLLFSILIRPGEALKVAEQFLLSQTVALALHGAMKSYDIDTRLKWPNDIYVGKRKLAGVLVELDYSGTFVEQAIIGVGINVNQVLFPVMDRIPVSMKMLQGRNFVTDEILETVIGCFERYYAELCKGNAEAITAQYTALLLGLNERCCYIDAAGPFEGVIEGVENDGHLLVRRSDGVLSRYAFKEIEQPL